MTLRSLPTFRMCVALLVALVAGCQPAMRDQPRYTALQPSEFFNDGRSARQPVENTVAHTSEPVSDAFTTGRVDGQYVEELPMKLTRERLERGRQRFTIYCALCHGASGYGDGMVVQRGFRQPPSYHTARLRAAPVGHFFDVATNGFGVMPSYAGQISIDDRWAIVAYVRALQLSQDATLGDVPAAEQQKLPGAAAP